MAGIISYSRKRLRRSVWAANVIGTPKDNIRPVLEWVCVNNLMEYCDKQKILKWFDKHQYNPGDVIKLLKDCVKVINEM